MLEKADFAEKNEVSDRHAGLTLEGQESVRRQNIELQYLLQLLLPLLRLQVYRRREAFHQAAVYLIFREN